MDILIILNIIGCVVLGFYCKKQYSLENLNKVNLVKNINRILSAIVIGLIFIGVMQIDHFIRNINFNSSIFSAVYMQMIVVIILKFSVTLICIIYTEVKGREYSKNQILKN
ncbi:hypothetical protein CF386_08745 [Paraphotobacterium marinum]|uniref:Uncharacterized protein n=1 Tax=Paraphotobacterium marinum TaxID=1755811 RepID=A0A220VFK7_9GAMM|nr:hypothetical protein [Paraphotobacterium marinum]ASK79147.1 hypothetical protein CF386_08745 [Paraphotobacterium marinum]